MSEKTRDYSLDNIRCFLIFTVVFAHLLEVCTPFSGKEILTEFLYSFHMPAFIFLFGYHARFRVERIVYRWCIPYVVFQSLYILFARVVLKDDMPFQYTMPYWLLWYMMTCIFYQLLLPVYETASKRRQVMTVLWAFALALIVGFEDSIGYELSLSRFFVFQPWFLLGYYCKTNGVLDAISVRSKKYKVFVFALMAGIMLSVPFLYFTSADVGLLYGAYSYAECDSSLWMRLVASMMALCWIVFLFVGARPYVNNKYACLTSIGQNTWPIFLLHGFLVKAIPVYCPSVLGTPWRVLLLTAGILVVMGNRVLNKVVYFVGGFWMEKFSKDM